MITKILKLEGFDFKQMELAVYIFVRVFMNPTEMKS